MSYGYGGHSYGRPAPGPSFGASQASGPEFSWDAVKNMNPLDKQQKAHLKYVYACLAMAGMAAFLGAALSVQFNLGGFMTMLGSVFCLVGLSSSPAIRENDVKRGVFLLGHAACTGMSLGPLLDNVAMIDPSIITTAFLGTCVIFGSFSLSAMFATQRSYLYLGGFLSSALSIMFMFSVVNMFFRVEALLLANLYMGLLVFCGYVMYDTQLILEKAKGPNPDFIGDSVQLLTDFVGIFVRILIILARNAGKKEERRKRDRSEL